MNDLGLGVVVSMKDAFSRNAHRIQSSMQSLDAAVARSSERMTRNFDHIQKGTMMVGAGLATLAVPAALVASTSASQKALGELASLGVRDLRAIEDAAERFTNQWAGTRKAEFITATYDIKSALSDLSDEAVGVFTSMAALTAKATKATTQEMVGTFTSGYGIFKPIMPDMSDMEWAEAFSGAMAQTVASFKTNGAQMADAIKNIGAVAASANVPLQEQLAVLGQLQTTMPGSEAGTLYKAFMMKAAEAGEELGLSFADSAGRLRSVPEILREIQGLYPDLSQAAAQVKLKKAFGSDEALKFVLQMSSGMEALEGNIESIHRAMKEGTVVTEQMARAMNMDIGAQTALLRQQLSNLAEILGRTLLPMATAMLKGLSRMVVFFQRVARSIPGLTRVSLAAASALGAILTVAGAVMSAIGLIGVVAPSVSAGVSAIGAAVTGTASAVAAWFWPVTLAIAGIVGAIVMMRHAWTTNLGGVREAVQSAWNRIGLVVRGVKELVLSMRGGVGQMSEELANRLKSARLLDFVVTIFKMYYRMREYQAGLWQSLTHAFSRARAIIEPGVLALIDAYKTFYSALYSVFQAFGLVSDTANGASMRSLGETVGKVLGVVIQLGAYLVRLSFLPMIRLVKTLTLLARGVGLIVRYSIMPMIRAVKFISRFVLPVRILGQAILTTGRMLYALWQTLTGDISVLDGLKAVGKAFFHFLMTPFHWLRDVVVGVFGFITGRIKAFFGWLRHLAGSIASVFLNLPIISSIRQAFAGVVQLIRGELDLREVGARMLRTLAEGILSVASFPYRALKRVLGKIRRLLPFSDAAEGPLSALTASGAALLKTFADGILSTASLPVKAIAKAFAGWRGLISPAQPEVPPIQQHVETLSTESIETAARMRVEQPERSAWERIRSFVHQRVAGLQAALPPLQFSFLGHAKMATLPQNIFDGLLRLAPKVDTQLVPRVFKAALLLTPLLAGALPTFAPASLPVEAIGPSFNKPSEPPIAKEPAGTRAEVVRYDTLPQVPSVAPQPVLYNAPPIQISTAPVINTPPLPEFSFPTPASTVNIAPPVFPLVQSHPPAMAPDIQVAVPPLSPAPISPERIEVFQQSAPPRPVITRESYTSDREVIREREDQLRPLLETLIARVESLADRPIELNVTTRIDGRKIAEAVYRDLRDQRIRNYETL